MEWLKRLCFIPLVLTLVGAGSCDSDSPTAPNGPAPGNPVTLPTTVTLVVGDSVHVDAVEVDVTFSSVAEDSRCPVDATCVWAGRAVVALAISGVNGTSSIELEVGRPPVQEQGLLLTADALDPQPREGQEIPPEDYRLELSLARAGG